MLFDSLNSKIIRIYKEIWLDQKNCVAKLERFMSWFIAISMINWRERKKEGDECKTLWYCKFDLARWWKIFEVENEFNFKTYYLLHYLFHTRFLGFVVRVLKAYLRWKFCHVVVGIIRSQPDIYSDSYSGPCKS